MNTRNCSGCGKPIGFVRMQTGGQMPVNPGLVSGTGQGLLVIDGAIVRKPLAEQQGFVPHWVTCPKAYSFRKEPRTTRRECPDCGARVKCGQLENGEWVELDSRKIFARKVPGKTLFLEGKLHPSPTRNFEGYTLHSETCRKPGLFSHGARAAGGPHGWN